MAKHKPSITGRGNVAPPIGYRPGLKARWLNPRPPRHNPQPEVNELLLTTPLVITYIDVPNNADEIPGPTVPAGACPICLVLTVTTPWDDIADNPRFNLLYPTITTPKLLFIGQRLGSDRVATASQYTTLPQPDYLDGDQIPTSAPQPTTFHFSKDGSAPTTQGSITLQIGYLPYP